MLPRNKATILRSGLDPELKKLRKLQAIKSRRAKQFTQACESVEHYWDNVFRAVEEADVSS